MAECTTQTLEEYVSGLPSANPLDGTEILFAVQDGNAVAITTAMLAAKYGTYNIILQGNGSDTVGDADIISSTPAGLTSLVGLNLLLVFVNNTMELADATYDDNAGTIQFGQSLSDTITILVTKQ